MTLVASRQNRYFRTSRPPHNPHISVKRDDPLLKLVGCIWARAAQGPHLTDELEKISNPSVLRVLPDLKSAAAADSCCSSLPPNCCLSFLVLDTLYLTCFPCVLHWQPAPPCYYNGQGNNTKQINTQTAPSARYVVVFRVQCRTSRQSVLYSTHKR